MDNKEQRLREEIARFRYAAGVSATNANIAIEAGDIQHSARCSLAQGLLDDCALRIEMILDGDSNG